ncbi:hypothetical protein DL89DRAFT_257941 [Linderina pennispora]|uniref:Uncharacterized protein n=1 Tax=Linderina pennispora TaxID=61395 RepID=A0A1Y1W8Y5_9FUNG|nr:uncharacterized protein DL89DRAFT_257941 [Linderina pennispora]ORX69716.1 hypothetical protein DL89DRAFT_257941 [Linderina pennispora]
MKVFSWILVSGLVLSGTDKQATAAPIFKDVAHQIGYDAKQAAAAGDAVYNGLEALFSALKNLDPFKPIMYPEVAGTLGTIETFGGVISNLVSWVVKVAINYVYTSDIGNDTPYIGELIRQASAEVPPEYRSAILRMVHELSLDAID